MNGEHAAPPEVSIIVPARNEEACLAECLQSLVTQEGVAFEMIVVDDGSTDRTRAIAESFAGVRVRFPGPLPHGWTGKSNALVAGAGEARGAWFLFTDADTVHLPGSLARALEEAKGEGADLLSYSPEQIAISFWEMATLPVVFAELARHYPPSKVNDPTSPIAAANGQFILVRRETYDAVGGHAAIAGELLEDVALARAVKSSGREIRFRYAADAVRTRMYRNFAQLREGWTKNLALLFPRPVNLAVRRFVSWVLTWSSATIAVYGVFDSHPILGLWMAVWLVTYWRIRSAHFSVVNNLLATGFGIPMFGYLLLRSKRAHRQGGVVWKGRRYDSQEVVTLAMHANVVKEQAS